MKIVKVQVAGKEYRFKVYKDKDGGYHAKCIEMPEAITQGDTLKELRFMMQDALELALEPVPNGAKLDTLSADSIVVNGRY
jgi:predicted RNase H-like HicB family nuclease